MTSVSARFLFRQNVRALLIARNENAASLAAWCSHDKSWASKVLAGDREPQLKDLDRIADFFGIDTYMLFQPGVEPLLERRKAERRSGKDRRSRVPAGAVLPGQPDTRPFMQFRRSRASDGDMRHPRKQEGPDGEPR